MHDLTPITALGGTAAQVDKVADVTCTEVPEVALTSVAARLGKEAAAAKAIKKLLGAAAPDVGKFADATLNAFWMAPSQWMVEAPFDTHEDLADQAKAAVDSSASVVEQTDAWTRFDLSGGQVLAVMELLCNTDSRRMEVGAAVRTSIHHLGCFVLRRGDQDFSIYAPRASAGSVHHAIVTGMRSAL